MTQPSSGDSEHAHDIEHGRAGLLAVLWGSIVSAVFAVVVQTQLFSGDVAHTFRIGRRGAVSGYDFFRSFALLGIGHLVGLSVGSAMFIGALIGWGWGVPHYSAIAGDVTTAAAQLAQSAWSHKVRFVGAGAIGVSAIWTLLKLVKPVASGLAGAMAASRARKGRADRFLEQPVIGHWHSGCDWRRVTARNRRKTVRRAGRWQSTDGIRPFHDRGDLQRCSDCKQ